jgi:hypothetical protein
MQLSVVERILALSVLPESGSLVTVRIVQDLKRALGFTEEEHAALKFQEVRADGQPPRLTWQPSVGETEIEIGVKAESIVRDALTKMDAEGRITAEYLSLCDKFRVGQE